jgi:hypothetical protein
MKILLLVSALFISANVFAASSSGETWSVGVLGGIVTSTQSDLNTLITRANTRVGGISTGQFGNAYEFGGYIQRRLNGSIIALQLRPSYYMASTTGTGTGGTFAYSLTGYTVAPLIKLYILESAGVKLYLVGGINYGILNGKIQEASATVEFKGSNVGYQGGIGTLFCFGQKGAHCISLEGNVRYLFIERNLVSSSTGTFSQSNPASVSQSGNGQELELDQKDLATTMSGVQGLLGYQYNF